MPKFHMHSTQIIGPIVEIQKLTTDDSTEVTFLLTVKILRPFRDSHNQPVYDYLNCIISANQRKTLIKDSLIGETVIVSGSLINLAFDNQAHLLLQAHSVLLKSALSPYGDEPLPVVAEDMIIQRPITC